MAGPVFYSAELPAELNEVEASLELAELERGALHAELLRRVGRLHAVMIAGGDVLGCCEAQLALLRGSSEVVANNLLDEALLLALLPGGVEALDCGLLSIEQSARPLRLARAPVSSERAPR